MQQDTQDEDDDLFLLQKDAVADWNPKGQEIDNENYDEEEEEKKEQQPWNKPDDGLYGDDVLSAVGMGQHKKVQNEGELGAISADDLGDLLD